MKHPFSTFYLVLIILPHISYGGDKTVDSKVYFDPIFLNSKKELNIDRFNYTSIPPGKYPIDVYINGKKKYSETLNVITTDSGLRVCFNKSTIKKMELNTLAEKEIDFTKNCILEKDSPRGIHVAYLPKEQIAKVSVPQIFLKINKDIDYSIWDSGITSLTTNYQFNYAYNSEDINSNESAYMGLNNKVNIGGWRLYNRGNIQWENDKTSYNRVSSYARKDIPSIKSELTIGETFHSGEIFDTFQYKGVAIRDSDAMLNDSDRQYIPVIHGFARTNAIVTVKQNDRIIYQDSVFPGEFEIDDIFPISFGGDLVVEVSESDGSNKHFIVPYNNNTFLLRKGRYHYEIASGYLEGNDLNSHPFFSQGTFQLGISDRVSLQTGLQLTKDYHSILLGASTNTEWGAVYFNANQAESSINQEKRLTKRKGRKIKLGYDKYIDNTQTQFSFQTSFYSKDFISLSSAYQKKDINDNKKSRSSININQSLKDGYGALYINADTVSYYGSRKNQNYYQIGYHNHFKGLSYSISTSRVSTYGGRDENSFQVNISLPLGRNTHVNSLFTHSNKGYSGEQISISGTDGENNNLSYNFTGSRFDNSASYASFSTQYKTPYNRLSTSTSFSKNSQSFNIGASGSLMVYRNGLVLSPFISDTSAIIEAEYAEGASIRPYSNVIIGENGRALLPNLTPYRENEISIETKNLENDIEVESTTKTVTPYYGSTSVLHFKTRKVYALLVESDNSNLSFGSEVYDKKGDKVGYVLQGGKILSKVDEVKGELFISEKKGHKECSFDYDLSNLNKKEAMFRTKGDIHCE